MYGIHFKNNFVSSVANSINFKIKKSFANPSRLTKVMPFLVTIFDHFAL